MILSGTLAAVPDQDAEATQWRAAAARDADAAATTVDQAVTATRHSAVREAVQVLATSTAYDDRELRREHVLALLAASVEKQARLSGLGRHRIARLVIA